MLLERTAFPRSNKTSAQAIINSLFQANYYTGVTTSGISLKCDGTTAQSGTTACQGIIDANVSVTQLPKSKKEESKIKITKDNKLRDVAFSCYRMFGAGLTDGLTFIIKT